MNIAMITTAEMLSLAIFLIVSIGLVIFSWPSFRKPGGHGFYRFFVFECILGLAVLNVPFWFSSPFSPAQLFSWLLLIIAGYLVISAVILLKRRGKAGSARQEDALLGFEKTTALVTEGLYSYIRHPMYSSLLFLAWGIFFKHPVLVTGCIALVASAFLLATARADEAECLRFFGPPYAEYMQRTKRFIPFIF